tara:strand:+ start:179 stop:844 length:666 start_codon:yes stop_codon:yes gene_type:complete
MKTDLHMHTHFSPDSELSPTNLIKRCQKVGLDCIAVTDHNTIRGALEVQKYAPFKVIIGEEITSTHGEITGLFLKEEIPSGLKPLETVERIRDQNGLVSIPHPFDRFRNNVIASDAIEKVAQVADIVEGFNSRNSAKSDNRKAHDFALKHGLIISAVSDAHTAMELGHTYMELPDFDGTPEDFKNALANARLISNRTNPLIHVLTALTKIKKRLVGSTQNR